MRLESRLAGIVAGAKKLRPELSGLLPDRIDLTGLSQTEISFLKLCAEVAETGDCSKKNALTLVKFAKIILAKRTDNGKLVKEQIGFWIFKRNCYLVAVKCLNAVDAATGRDRKVELHAVDEVRGLAETVDNPALAKFLKESADILSGRGHEAGRFPCSFSITPLKKIQRSPFGQG